MTLPAHSSLDVVDSADTAEIPAPAAFDPAAFMSQVEVQAADETVSIDLNFKAFADHVSPDQHAKRVVRGSDPSVQDFADQALELAALRAELKRLTRDYDSLQHAMQLRDARLQSIRAELAAVRAREKERASFEKLSQPSPIATDVALEAPCSAKSPAPAPSHDAHAAHELSSTLALPHPPGAPSADSAAACPAPRTTQNAHGSRPSPLRQLISVDHDGDVVLLCGDVMTIGRTRENDICIPSRGVSRDHARLLLNQRGVTIVDMDSANGCFVNGERVKKHKLKDGELLRIGDRSFRFLDGFGASR